MRVELKDFQVDAVCLLHQRLSQMWSAYERDGALSSVCLSSVTGSGKTVMCAAVIEALFFGNDELGLSPDPHACVLWVSDSPSLNGQTHARFAECADKLADWIADRRCLEDVSNNFCAGHEMLEPGHVYFLSKDLLGSKNRLVRGGEDNSGRVFWDVLDRTIRDPSVNLYLFIDEAHRGFDSKRAAGGNADTIFGYLVNGYEGRAPAPMVVGVSATPERFEARMEAMEDRDRKASVRVSPIDVQESGLVKDTIELRVPDDDDPVEHQYLTMAAERFRLAQERWETYCVAEDEPRVSPLLIVQVKNAINGEGLADLCEQICQAVPGLDRSRSFANVFGEHADIVAGRFLVPYIAPELVQQERHVQVLFAKTAVSNGWDCPRAEVIFSQRPYNDPTVIAQLIGRMVRTPLARRIDSDDMLNAIACYLPQFNPESTKGVVDYLTGKTDEMGGVGRPAVQVAPVTVAAAVPRTQEEYEIAWNLWKRAEDALRAPAMTVARENRGEEVGAPGYQPPLIEGFESPDPIEQVPLFSQEETGAPLLPSREHGVSFVDKEPPRPPCERDHSFSREEYAGIQRAFSSIPCRRAPRKARNEFKALLDSATLFVESGVDVNAATEVNELFSKELDGCLIACEDDVIATRAEIETTNTRVIRIDKRHGDEVTETGEAVEVDDDGIAKAAREADVRFGGKELTNAYRRRLMGNGVAARERNLRLACAAKTPQVVERLTVWAKELRRTLFDRHNSSYDFMDERYQQRYRTLESETASRLTTKMIWPDMMSLPRSSQRYPRHIVQEADGLCPLRLNPLEDLVVRRELDRDRTVAFYRNPSNCSQQVFSFPYRMPDGIHSCNPDFIFFVRDRKGEIRPTIVDPHGAHLGDTIPKLKGYVEYLQEFPDVFAQVLFVGDLGNGQLRSLNLLRADVQAAITGFSGDSAQELFLDEFVSHAYV